MDSLIKDNVVFTILSERRLGPKLYAVFAEGRLEEFVPSRSVDSAVLLSYPLVNLHFIVEQEVRIALPLGNCTGRASCSLSIKVKQIHVRDHQVHPVVQSQNATECRSNRSLGCGEGVRDPAISAVIARKMARIHRLSVPISKDNVWLADALNKVSDTRTTKKRVEI